MTDFPPVSRPDGGIADRRSFLFLQGIASDFFNRLGKVLAARGSEVHRVNFNGGDMVFWRQPNAVNFRGRPSEWPDFVAKLIRASGITDLILFGDCRPVHSAAIIVARQLGLQVHVCEEGYIRPNWVTLEMGGVNGNSSLPRDPDWYRTHAVGLPSLDGDVAVPASFARRVREDVTYNVASMLLCWAFPFYRTHRPWHPMVEYAGWIWRLSHGRQAAKRARGALRRISGAGTFFAFPLQLTCDFQVRQHSSFGAMEPAIQRVVTSFAKHAPHDSLLAVKEHPLDNGLRNWRRLTARIAAAAGVADRVVYLERGNLADLMQQARGVVTINSTSGTLALAHHVPVVTLGRAIYDVPGITFQGDLDRFWAALEPPDAALFDDFRRVLTKHCLIRGGFFSEEGLDMLVAEAAMRLQASPRSAPARVLKVAAQARPSQVITDFAPVVR